MPPVHNMIEHADPQKRELVRLMLHKTVETLELESGLELESQLVRDFRRIILSGEWEMVPSIIQRLDTKSGSESFLELLEQGKKQEAALVLRHDIYLMCNSVEELKKMAGWDGVLGQSRTLLLESLSEHISFTMMLPPRRLQTLLDQAQTHQRSKCLYHSQYDQHATLYTDHICDRRSFPNTTTHILEEHADEVWFLSFSNNGKMLGSASRDAHAIIWDVENFKVLHILDHHKKAISFLAWHPDDLLILTASNDHTLKLWDTRSGELKHTYARHMESVTSCAWLPSGDKFVSGSLEKHVYLWSVNGDVLYKWSGFRTMDLSVSRDGQTLIACSERRIRIFNLDDKSEVSTFEESDSITSVYLANDGEHMLEIHLWNLKEKKIVKNFVGQKQGRFVIRSCFGGQDEHFISKSMSGTENMDV
ncbi:WD40-repeat-containing domain protein [Gorgonomyces haynaldii]|nr:WD40-repeat-containing domain protein [Gorgonomyces haynaldii]